MQAVFPGLLVIHLCGVRAGHTTEKLDRTPFLVPGRSCHKVSRIIGVLVDVEREEDFSQGPGRLRLWRPGSPGIGVPEVSLVPGGCHLKSTTLPRHEKIKTKVLGIRDFFYPKGCTKMLWDRMEQGM